MSKFDKPYTEQREIKNELYLKSIQEQMPDYIHLYLRGIKTGTTSQTRVAYMQDIQTFFNWLLAVNPSLKNKTYFDITLDVLENLKADDFEEYIDCVRLYDKGDKVVKNQNTSLRRKLSALRSLYEYLYKREYIDKNPILRVDMPKVSAKDLQNKIVRLEPNETAKLLDNVEYGESLTKSQLRLHDNYKIRDLAIVTLMLGTGIRVSECVGIDVQDIDFDNSRITITRKGEITDTVYFNNEVKEALLNYIESNRCTAPARLGHENALFLSNRMTRITVRSVENIVKKYSVGVIKGKKISPHKLRSTYGTALYHETNDIYLTGAVLGHSNINNTLRYAEQTSERKRSVKDLVALREDYCIKG